MIPEQYNVIFSGEIIEGYNIDDVKSHIANLFKVDVTKIENYFHGKELIVKAGVDLQTAQKIQASFKKGGALCRIEPIKSALSEEATILLPALQRDALLENHTKQVVFAKNDTTIEYVPANTQEGGIAQRVILGFVSIIIRLAWTFTIGLLFFIIGTILFILLDILFPRYATSYKVLTNMYKWGSCHWFKQLKLETDQYSIEVEKKRP